MGCAQRLRPAVVKVSFCLGSRRIGPRGGSQRENGQTHVDQLSGVSMQPSTHDPGESGGLSLDGHRVSDTSLVRAAGVVDYETRPRLGRVDRLDKDVDRPGVASRDRRTVDRHRRMDRNETIRSHPGSVACPEGGKMSGRQIDKSHKTRLFHHECHLLLFPATVQGVLTADPSQGSIRRRRHPTGRAASGSIRAR